MVITLTYGFLFLFLCGLVVFVLPPLLSRHLVELIEQLPEVLSFYPAQSEPRELEDPRPVQQQLKM